MEIQVETQSERVSITIKGELDVNSAPSVADQFNAVVEARPAEVNVDLTELRLIDSTGVGVLVALFKRVRAYEGRFTLDGVQGQPRSIFKLLKLDQVFGIPPV